MSERGWPAVRVRPVRGRVIDPFRGALHDEDPERFADRAVDAQPLDDVLAAIEGLPDVRVVRTGRRFTLGRGHDVAKVSFASAARTVSLADTAFEGDGALILALVHRLLPLFGAVEVRIGTHRELVDGHEPLDAILKRYETWWVDESLRLAKQLADRPRPAPAHRAPATVGRGLRPAQRAVIGGIIAAVGVAWLIRSALTPEIVDAPRRSEVGEPCTRNADCWGECLPHGTAGVCTHVCTTDAECPSSMRCGDVYMVNQVVGTRRHAQRCVPQDR